MYSYETVLPTPPFPLVAADTETCRFTEPRHDSRRKTRHEPFTYPRLILGSLAYDNKVEVLRDELFLRRLSDLLASGKHLAFHNAPFDFFVCQRYLRELAVCCAGLGNDCRSLEAELLRAVDENRIHDTKILEQLIQIARGDTTPDNRVIRPESLDTLARRRAGMSLDKDPAIRLGFEAYLYDDPPPHFLKYAADDAEATYRVFCNQWRELQLYTPPDADERLLPGARNLFGPLSSSIQVKGALGLAWLEQHPLRVDLQEVAAVRHTLLEESNRLREALVAFGFARLTPRKREFKLLQKHLRTVLSGYAAGARLVPPRSSTGLLSLQYDFWRGAIPHLPSRLVQAPCDANGIEEQVAVWLRYCRVHKLLATYIDPYSTSPVHYPTYHNLGARTTRTSCVRPNIQNIPKRRDGIRSLFVARSGYRLIEADYRAAELVALAQVYHRLFGGSVLGEAINGGLDPHIETARRLDPRFDLLPESDRKRLRQAAKAINFGLPGGLGAAKFQLYANKTYGLSLTESEARLLRNQALDADPQLRAYLNSGGSQRSRFALAASNLGISEPTLIGCLQAWRDEDAGEAHSDLAWARLRKWSFGDTRFEIPTPPGFDRRFDLFRTAAVSPSGVVRGRCSFTEAHNLPFQSLVACGSKLAAWNLYKAHLSDPFWSPCAFIHDSFLIEAPEDRAQEAGETLKTAMQQGLRAVCPDIRVEVDLTEPSPRWGKSSISLGDTTT